MDENNETLRSLAVRALASAGTSRVKVLDLLSMYDKCGNEDDIVYAVVFELEVLHWLQERIHTENNQRHELLVNRMTEILNRNQEEILALVCRQEQISRSQFRRLTALHRERFANRLILVCALTILSVLAGLGTFFIYSVWR